MIASGLPQDYYRRWTDSAEASVAVFSDPGERYINIQADGNWHTGTLVELTPEQASELVVQLQLILHSKGA